MAAFEGNENHDNRVVEIDIEKILFLNKLVITGVDIVFV